MYTYTRPDQAKPCPECQSTDVNPTGCSKMIFMSPAANVIISEHAEVIVDTSVILFCFIRNLADENLILTSSYIF
jgi:hypothetical protein